MKSTQFTLDGQESINIHREWSMPSRWTFEIDAVDGFLQRHISDGLWIDPFSGKNSPADITNDLNPEIDTDYTLPADEFLKRFDENEVDGGIILDPPYNATQLKRLYDEIDIDIEQNDTNASFYARPRDHAKRILQSGAKALSFGWDSNGCGKGRGFVKDEILLVAHGSCRNDTICVAELLND